MIPRGIQLWFAVLLLLAGCAPDGGKWVEDASAVLIGNLFESVTGQVLTEGVVVLAGDRVACSGPQNACRWDSTVPEHRYAEALILPGLIDLHAHVRRHFARAYLPSGVTTIRDVSNTVATIQEARDLPGTPRIFSTGAELDGPGSFFADASGPSGPPDSTTLEHVIPLIVRHQGDATRAVELLSGAGMDWLKLREMLEIQVFRALVEEGRAAGMPATADLGLIITGGLRGPRVDIVDATRAGLASIEHFSGLPLAYQRRGGDLFAPGLDEGIVDDIAAELITADVHLVPTAAVLGLIEDSQLLQLDDLPGFDILEPVFRAHWSRLEGITLNVRDEIAADLRLWRAMLDRMREAGMVIGAGSDAPNAPNLFPAAGLHQELEALVAAGLTPVEALQAATHTAATILLRPELGTLQAGAHADVLVVRGDPLEDIRLTRQILAVWVSGREVDLEAAWDVVQEDLKALDGPVWHPTER